MDSGRPGLGLAVGGETWCQEPGGWGSGPAPQGGEALCPLPPPPHTSLLEGTTQQVASTVASLGNTEQQIALVQAPGDFPTVSAKMKC